MDAMDARMVAKVFEFISIDASKANLTQGPDTWWEIGDTTDAINSGIWRRPETKILEDISCIIVHFYVINRVCSLGKSSEKKVELSLN